jgi:hypothetical protein
MKVLPPPGPVRTRQLALLGALLVAVAYTVWRVVGPGPASPPRPASNPQVSAAPAATRTGTTAGPTGQLQKTMPQPVQLGKLEPVPDEPAATRNPFRFGTKPVPPPPVSAYVPPPAPPPGPPPPPPVPPIPLKFIGRTVMPDRRVVASLSDGKGTALRGMEGQIIDGRYRIVKIGEESIVMESVNGTGRQTLQLRGG